MADFAVSPKMADLDLHYFLENAFSNIHHFQAPRLRVGNFYFSTKTYVVGTQKNRLNETVLLSTQNKCLNWWIRKY